MSSFLMDKDDARETINSQLVTQEDSITIGSTQSEGTGITTDIKSDGIVMPSCAKSGLMTPLPKKRRNREPDEIVKILKKSYSILETAVSQRSTKKDECTIIGELVTIKLQDMAPELRAVAVQQIINILFKVPVQKNFK